jgi:hypothetical protein
VFRRDSGPRRTTTGTRADRDQLASDAPEQGGLEPARAAGADDNQLGVGRGGDGRELLGRIAQRNAGDRVPAGGDVCGGSLEPLDPDRD